jgi:hypothetical protein
LDYDYDQVTIRRGTVSSDEYRVFKEEGKPTGWSGGCFGAAIIDLTNEEMDLFLADPKEFQKKHSALLEKKAEEYKGLLKDSPAAGGFEIMREAMEETQDFSMLKFFTRVEWKEPYRDAIGDWWFDVTLVKLQELAPDGDLSKIRYVFFFDN